MKLNDKKSTENWKDRIPTPVYDEHPEYNELYNKEWELAFEHIKSILVVNYNMPFKVWEDINDFLGGKAYMTVSTLCVWTKGKCEKEEKSADNIFHCGE